MLNCLVLLSSIVLISAGLGGRPWYSAASTFAEFDVVVLSSCAHTCNTTLDCDASLSCFPTTSETIGCCLKALKPNETDCILDEQCKRACESSFCDRRQQPSRCLCETGRHFLFNKCWKKCPAFAHEQPKLESNGFSRCELKVGVDVALGYMRRHRRQMKAARVFC